MSSETPKPDLRFMMLRKFRDALARLVAANEELADASDAFNALGFADEPLESARYREVAAGHRATLANVDKMIAQYQAESN
jgi:hypothetical protein